MVSSFCQYHVQLPVNYAYLFFVLGFRRHSIQYYQHGSHREKIDVFLMEQVINAVNEFYCLEKQIK